MKLTRQEQMHSITSPTRKQSNVDDDSDLDIDEEAAAAIAADLDFADDSNGATIDVETLGMTNERQQEIQGSLFKMLGSENKEVKPQRRGGQLGSTSDDVGDIKEEEDETANAKSEDDDILVSSSG